MGQRNNKTILLYKVWEAQYSQEHRQTLVQLRFKLYTHKYNTQRCGSNDCIHISSQFHCKSSLTLGYGAFAFPPFAWPDSTTQSLVLDSASSVVFAHAALELHFLSW
jgi:hypothetical protein